MGFGPGDDGYEPPQPDNRHGQIIEREAPKDIRQGEAQ